MPISEDLLKIVPVGEENAVTARLLWTQLGMWSYASVKYELNRLAKFGVIERKHVRLSDLQTSLYFKP